MLFTISIFIISLQFTINIYNSNQISLGLGIKMAYAYAGIPVGFLLLSIRVIQKELFPKYSCQKGEES